MDLSFGILTMATPGDFRKAIGLALSLRVSNPGVPIAVACSPKVRPLVAPHFDIVVDEDPSLRGFVHKIHMDRYSPFEETVFFDSDVLVFKPVLPAIAAWRTQPYSACGRWMSEADCLSTAGSRTSSFGMDRIAVMRQLGCSRLVVIDGAGHAYFHRETSRRFFERLREVTRDHQALLGPIPFADEDVVDYVMTEMNLPPMPEQGFFSRHISARRRSLRMDASRGICDLIRADTGLADQPCMMHFAANEAPIGYHRQLWRLFRQAGLATDGLVAEAAHDWFMREIRDPASKWKRRLLRAGGLSK